MDAWCSPVNTPRKLAGRSRVRIPSHKNMDCVVYIIQNAQSHYYVGVTTDIGRRLEEHGRGQNRSTRGKGPWTLVYMENYPSSLEAKRREHEIKKKKSKHYIDWLIQNAHGCVV